ncbi:MAG: glucose 1-dehydrogenase [Deltaproteobacteria bacterium]|nr:glucose 1-dehydrogenase [Deltaproteobacteria bacterium]
MSNRLTGKVALITGGGSGIGEATAKRFAASGAKVVVTGRRAAMLEPVAEATGGLAVPGDAGDPDQSAKAVAAAVDAFGGLDILVANAAVEYFGSATEVDLDSWHEMFRVNVDGVLLSARAAIEAMRERGGGAIVVVASVASLVGPPEYVSYATTKSALLGMTRSMARDFGPEGIRVNAICPGWTRSEMVERAMEELGNRAGVGLEEAVRRATMFYPLKRMADPSEIASCIEFLASEDASFVTGAVLVADGGATIADVGMLGFEV